MLLQMQPKKESAAKALRAITIITGTRAEYGLLRPVMRAIANHSKLKLKTIVTGTHLLPPANTIDEVAAEFDIAATVPMQIDNQTGRFADAAALGRGIAGLAAHLEHDPPDIVLVLGDRIEAFAAASAAAVAGNHIAHMHGGDRGEGVADESMRHAITKLAHIHLPATETSAHRIIAMGEDPPRVHIVGSPAIDGLDQIKPMSDGESAKLGSPQIIIVLHPIGDDDATEHDRAMRLLQIATQAGPTLVMHPNHDPGRDGIIRAIGESRCRAVPHLPRDTFVSLLRRARVIIGNSSAGMIECSAIPIRAINIGPRQAGREMPSNVTDIATWDYQTIERSLRECLNASPLGPGAAEVKHPYGDGHAGTRTAKLLAELDFALHPLRKRNTY